MKVGSKKVILLISIIFASLFGFASPDSINVLKEIEVLKAEISNASKPKDIFKLNLETSKKYFAIKNITQAIVYANNSYEIAAAQNDKAMQSMALEQLADILLLQANLDGALSNYMRSLIIEKELNNLMRVSTLHRKIGDIYLQKFEIQKAVDAYQKALLLLTNQNDLHALAQTYTKLGTVYRSNLGRATEAIKYYEKSNEIYLNLNDSVQIAWNLNRIGNCNIDLGNYSKAYDLYQEALKIFTDKNDVIGIVAAYNNSGEIFRYQGNYTNALENYLQGLKISRETNDARSMSILYNNIGIIYYEQNLPEVAFEYFNNSLNYGNKINFKEGAVETYIYMGLTEQSKGNIAKALEFLNKSLAISEAIGDWLGNAFALNSIANINFLQNEYKEAEKHFKDALDIANRVQDRNNKITSLIGLAKVRHATKNSRKAIMNLDEALQIAIEIGVKPKIVNIYELLSTIHENQNKNEKALYYFKKYHNLSDSLENSKVTQQIEVMQDKYISDQREKEFELLRKEKELQSAELDKKQAQIKEQNLKQRVTAIALVLFLISSVFIFIGYNERKKAFKTLEFQKHEIEAINNDLTSSIQYAKRIQRAVLTSEEYLSNVFSQYFVFYKPKDIVSGDFYWVYQSASTGKIIVAVVDCTGHGVPGAFMSLVGMSLLNEIVMEHKLYETDLILDKMRQGVIKALKQKGAENESLDGMDVSIAIWDKRNAVMQFSGANNPLIVVRKNQLLEFKGDKQPIGYFGKHQKPFNKTEFELQTNDMVYLFSDGYADQFGGYNNKKFKYSQFKNLLKSIASLSIEEQKLRIEENFQSWKGSFDQLDDICVFGFRVN